MVVDAVTPNRSARGILPAIREIFREIGYLRAIFSRPTPKIARNSGRFVENLFCDRTGRFIVISGSRGSSSSECHMPPCHSERAHHRHRFAVHRIRPMRNYDISFRIGVNTDGLICRVES